MLPWYVILLIVVALFTLPFLIGGFLARKFRMPDHGWKIGLILWSLACGLVIIGFSDGVKRGIDLSGGLILIYEVDQDKKEEDRTLSGQEMDRLIAAVSRRVNPGGQKEVVIRKYGVEQIEIIIPKVEEAEAERIKRSISRAGTLEFRILANNRDHKLLIAKAKAQSGRVIRDAAGKELGRWVPMDLGDGDPADQERVSQITGFKEIATRDFPLRGRDVPHVLVVKDAFNVTGGYLRRAQADYDRQGKPCVTFIFNSQGGQLFGGLTSNNLPDKVQDFTRKLGIILDGNLYSAPSIQSTIFDRGEITGSFDQDEVNDLVGVLNAGSLPTALAEEPISQLFTGPTLGQDTINKGKWAIGGSMILVLLFMLFYYRFAGFVACGALLINLVLILAIMITVSAALTLPGLAGLVLTVGMAVDANVLVFERIREELNRGAALRMAIRNGFARATTTIVDANLTTLIVATVLWTIGTDQIKGFAVTLWLGVVLSMYTAIFCSRVVFDVAERRRWLTKLKMMRILGATKIDFLARRHVAAIGSILLIVIGMAGVFFRGAGLLDIDFTGGVRVEVLFTEPQNISQLRKTLEKEQQLPDLAVSDVQIEGEAPNLRFVINTSQSEEKDEKGQRIPAIDVVERKIHDAFAGKLATNSMAYKDATDEKPAAEKPEKPEKPSTAEQSRRDLPPDSLLAAAGPGAFALAQADTDTGDSPPSDAAEEPGGETPTVETKPAETKPAETPPAKKPAPEEAATIEEGPFAGGYEANLTLKKALDHDTLADLFPEDVAVKLGNERYDKGDDSAFEQWKVTIARPQQEAEKILDDIDARLKDRPFFPSSNAIGGKVAGDTRMLAVAALLTSLLLIVGYIWIRFQRVVFGLAAVVALVHDVLITLGILALSAYIVKIPGTEYLLIDPFKIGLPVLAAFLTIIGYSLNDTIVVFDRIREVRGKAPRLTGDMVNLSINQTLSRTLLTSMTTLIVVLILYAAGGQGIHGFAFTLVVGVLVGTYSSVFVASPALLWMSRPAGGK